MKKNDYFEANSGLELTRLKVVLESLGYKTRIDNKALKPRLVITRVTLKARLRRWKNEKVNRENRS